MWLNLIHSENKTNNNKHGMAGIRNVSAFSPFLWFSQATWTQDVLTLSFLQLSLLFNFLFLSLNFLISFMCFSLKHPSVFSDHCSDGHMPTALLTRRAKPQRKESRFPSMAAADPKHAKAPWKGQDTPGIANMGET